VLSRAHPAVFLTESLLAVAAMGLFLRARSTVVPADSIGASTESGTPSDAGEERRRRLAGTTVLRAHLARLAAPSLAPASLGVLIVAGASRADAFHAAILTIALVFAASPGLARRAWPVAVAATQLGLLGVFVFSVAAVRRWARFGDSDAARDLGLVRSESVFAGVGEWAGLAVVAGVQGVAYRAAQRFGGPPLFFSFSFFLLIFTWRRFYHCDLVVYAHPCPLPFDSQRCVLLNIHHLLTPSQRQATLRPWWVRLIPLLSLMPPPLYLAVFFVSIARVSLMNTLLMTVVMLCMAVHTVVVASRAKGYV
jgi:hypothetical protein